MTRPPCTGELAYPCLAFLRSEAPRLEPQRSLRRLEEWRFFPLDLRCDFFAEGRRGSWIGWGCAPPRAAHGLRPSQGQGPGWSRGPGLGAGRRRQRRKWAPATDAARGLLALAEEEEAKEAGTQAQTMAQVAAKQVAAVVPCIWATRSSEAAGVPEGSHASAGAAP